ncbi:MAG: DUF4079 domain-containing protein [Cyanobacteria bacterium P01_C01_bin.70]
MDLGVLEPIKPYLNFFHPLLMWALFALSIYATYSGFKIRQMRSATGEQKKKIAKGKFRIRHHHWGAALLAMMVLGSIGGMAVTYVNNGKLFVGPHLLVGLGMTGIIATSASLVPFMQRGNDIARSTHIALNVIMVGLFGWEAVTGMQIMQRILANF